MKVRVTRQKRRGGKVWVVDWTDRSGKRHQPRFDTKEAAEAEEERIRATLRAQHGRTPELPEDTTWTGLFERVMADRGDLKPRTLESYRETHARHLAPVFGATAVRDLVRTRCKEFLRRQLTDYSRDSVRLMHVTLHVVLEEAVEDGLIPANPVSGLARKLKLSGKVKARQDATRKKAMTREERDAFLATAERVVPWWAPMWTVQTLTGLRPGEVYALEEGDLDLDRRILRVERTLSDDGQRIDTPKGGFSREVDLSNEAVRVLRGHLVRRRAEKLKRKWRELPRPLFCSTTGTSPDPSGVRQAFRSVCLKAGLVRERTGPDSKPAKVARVTPHGLRHTFAALHLKAGTDVYYVSRMLGHADISLTVHTYGAWLKPDRRPGLDVLDRTPAEADAEEARA